MPVSKINQSRKLTAKQSMFIVEYLIDLNATQAAIRAGYSKKTAAQMGAENLIKPVIAKAIEQAMRERTEQVEMNANYVLNRLCEETEADLADLYNTDGTFKAVHEWPVVWRKGLVTSVDTLNQGGDEACVMVTKVRLSDRVKRLELIGKHFAMFTQNINMGSDDSLSKLSDEELNEKIDELLIKRGTN